MAQYIQEQLRHTGFVTSEKSMLPRSLKRYCNLEIKKLDDSNLVNDQRNTVESYIKRIANQKNKPSLGDNKPDLP